MNPLYEHFPVPFLQIAQADQVGTSDLRGGTSGLCRTTPIKGNMLAGLTRPVPLKAVCIDLIIDRFAPGRDLAWANFRSRWVE